MKLTKLTALLICAVFMLCSCGKKNEEPPKDEFKLTELTAELSENMGDAVRVMTEERVPAVRSELIAEGLAEPVDYAPEVTLPEFAAGGVMCADTGEYLYTKNPKEHIAPASMTKLLTACVALKYIKPDEICTVGSELDFVRFDSSMAYIGRGEQMTMYDLLTGMLLCSGNDAAYTVAVNTARKLDPKTDMDDSEAVNYFCLHMNQFAMDIGMTDSNFMNPDGWDSEYQFTTVADLLTLGQYVLDVPEVMEIAGCAHKELVIKSGESYTWDNSNRLLREEDTFNRDDAIGLKTGSTIAAGYCLIAAFDRPDGTYLTVVANSDTDPERYIATVGLMEKYAKRVEN